MNSRRSVTVQEWAEADGHDWWDICRKQRKSTAYQLLTGEAVALARGVRRPLRDRPPWAWNDCEDVAERALGAALIDISKGLATGKVEPLEHRFRACLRHFVLRRLSRALRAWTRDERPGHCLPIASPALDETRHIAADPEVAYLRYALTKQALDAASAPQRTAMALMAMGWTQVDIADSEGVSQAAISQRVTAGLARARRVVDPAL